MLSFYECLSEAEANSKTHPAYAQVFATMAIAIAIKEGNTQVYPELADLNREQDIKIDDWINDAENHGEQKD